MGQYIRHAPDSHALTFRDDEIDLLELLKALKKNIGLILLVTGFTTLLAIGYAFLTPPTYQATALVGQPSPANLHLIDQGAGLYKLSPEDEYDRLYRTLINQDLQKQFYIEKVANQSEQHSSPLTQKSFDAFREQITISKKDKNRKVSHAHMEIAFTSHNAEEAYRLLTEFLDFMNAAALRDIQSDYMASVDAAIHNIEKEIAQLIKSKQMNINNEITRLKEALKLAESLNIKSERYTSIEALRALSSDDPSIHLLGAEFLNARIQMLEKRKDLTPFIPGVAELKAHLAGLKALQLNTNNINLFEFEKSPTIPYQHIKPKRALICVLGLMLGVLLGCALALLNSFIAKVRNESQAVADNSKPKPSGVHSDKAEAISYVLASEYTTTKGKVAASKNQA